MSLRPLILTFFLVLAAASAVAKERTWTSADGRAMKAEFVREVDGVVTFLKEGKLVSIPLDRLSEKDQQIVRDLAMGKPVPEEEPDAANPFESTPPAVGNKGTTTPETKSSSSPAAPRVSIEVRAWTDERGNTISAKFVRMNGTNVVLNRSGKILSVVFYTLSEDDQQYLRDLLAQQGKEELIPPPRSAPAASGTTGGTDPGAAAGPVTGGLPASPFPPGTGGPGLAGGAGGPSGSSPPGLPSGGFPGGGFPGGGLPGAGIPSGGVPSGLPGGGMPGGVPSGSPRGIGSNGLNSGGMGGPSGFGEPGYPGGSSSPGIGGGSNFGGGSRIPTSFPDTSFPRQPSMPPFASGPTYQQVFKCSGCQREISQEQSKLDRCPYCRTIWVYKEDGTGNKQMTSGGVRNMAIGIGIVVLAVVFGGVAAFIGIIVAIVRAVSRPARANYRRY